jgi:hypothetical protein
VSTATWTPAAAFRTLPDGATEVIGILGPRPDTGPPSEGYGQLQPQAFLANRGPDAPIAPHYHPVGQYQCIVGGEGFIGRDPVRTGVVQWADALQPYGPIRPGPGGLAFLTLRAVTDGGVQWMPEHQADLRDALAAAPGGADRRRNLVFDLPGRAESGGWTDLCRSEDGLRVGVVVADGVTDLPTVEGGGAYLVVLAGAVRDAAALHGPGALAWAATGTAPTIAPATGGATVGLLQFPTVERTAP